jgi:hypothetical protein
MLPLLRYTLSATCTAAAAAAAVLSITCCRHASAAAAVPGLVCCELGDISSDASNSVSYPPACAAAAVTDSQSFDRLLLALGRHVIRQLSSLLQLLANESATLSGC